MLEKLKFWKPKAEIILPNPEGVGLDEAREVSKISRALTLQKKKSNLELEKAMFELEMEKQKLDVEKVKESIKAMQQERRLTSMERMAELGGLAGSEGDSESSLMDKMMLGLMDKFMNKDNPAPPPQTNINQFNEKVPEEEKLPTMTDEQIKAYLKEQPAHMIKIARTLPDNVLRLQIENLLPVDDDTINRAILIIKNKQVKK